MMLANGFMRPRLFLSAVEIGLFTVLAGGPATEEHIRERTGIHPRGARDFLDALVAIDLLEKNGDLYSNTPISDYYLDREKSTYLGYPEWIASSGFPSWARFTEALRTGLRQDPRGTTGGELFDLFDDPDEVRRTMRGADSMSTALAPDVIANVDWARYRDFVDLGGARGNLSAALVTANPHMTGICFDLAVIKPFFTEHMDTRGIPDDRVRFQEGDFFADPLPEADVMICGHALHNHHVDRRKALIASVFESLRPGGVFVVYDVLFDEDRRDLLPLMWSLSMLVQTAHGSEYSVSDIRGWLHEAGFGTVAATPIRDRNILVVAHKDR